MLTISNEVSTANGFVKIDLGVRQSALAIISNGDKGGMAVASWRSADDPLTVTAVSLPTDATADASGNSFVVHTDYVSLVTFIVFRG